MPIDFGKKCRCLFVPILQSCDKCSHFCQQKALFRTEKELLSFFVELFKTFFNLSRNKSVTSCRPNELPSQKEKLSAEKCKPALSEKRDSDSKNRPPQRKFNKPEHVNPVHAGGNFLQAQGEKSALGEKEKNPRRSCQITAVKSEETPRCCRNFTMVAAPLHHGGVFTAPWWSFYGTMVEWHRHRGVFPDFSMVFFLLHHGVFPKKP